MILPDPVDHHARRQWILRIGEPCGQNGTTPRRVQSWRWSNLRVAGIQNGKEAGLDLVSFSLPVAAAQNVCRRSCRTDVDHELALWQGRGPERIELRELFFEFGVAFAVVAFETAESPGIGLLVKRNSRLGCLIHHL